MQYPHFYTQVEPIKLYDPLSDILGAFEEGIVEIGYIDCVKFAGHSCPTVAGAYLMAKEGLKALFGDTLPQRGFVKVEIKDAKDHGVAGVVGNLIAFITGASDEAGFKGLQGKFSRNNLVSYHQPMEGEVTLSRTDTRDSVTLRYDPSSVPSDERMGSLMQKQMAGAASKEEKTLFKILWQQRVETILLETERRDTLITTIYNKG